MADTTAQAESHQRSGHDIREVAILFLRLGFTAFGGPAAHIAMMEDEVVRRRQWMPRGRFLDLLGAANLIPGPSSTELAIYIGYTRAGWAGLVLGGICFIFPAAAITLFFAWMYVRFGHLPQIEGLLYGVKPVVIAIILQALWKLGTTAVRTRTLALFGAAALVTAALTGRTLSLLVATGACMAAVKALQSKTATGAQKAAIVPGLSAVFGFPAAAAGAVGLLPLFLVFLKIGAIVFGSGYVLLAFLRADLIEHYHWLTDTQLLDAVAVGQVTPGPVFTTATFIGYLLAGVPGAVAASVAIFLPGFLLVAASGPLIPCLRRSPLTAAFLDGVTVAALALMALVTWQLGRSSITDAVTATIAAASAILLLRFRVNSAWLIAGGAAIGLLLHH